MLPAIMISLSICAASANDIAAPELPPWPDALPAPVVSEAGTLLPPLLADAVHLRLEACEAMPARCAARLSAQSEVMASECESRLRLTRLDAVAPVDPVMPWLLGGLVGAVLGAAGVAAVWLSR